MRNLYKFVIVLGFFLAVPSFVLFAQVGINTDNSLPDSSAMLDVSATNKGLLVPRVALTATNVAEPITSPATSLLVYNTATAGTSPNNVTPGYYYWNDSAWVRLSTLGGSGTPDFLPKWSSAGTLGNSLIFDNGTNVGIGTTSPSKKLDISGEMQATGTGINYFAGKVGIGTSSPAASAAVDITSTVQGFLPPRMTFWQRDAIANPVAGLVIFCTDCGTSGELQVHNGTAWTNMTGTASGCGVFTINHTTTGLVAPVNKTVTYGTVINIPGEPHKCWINRNLGADRQATAVNDATEASAGWYFQFNRNQGYKHDGTRTPNTNWITDINETSDWITANDPCAIELGTGWRIPTSTEWTNIDAAGVWTNWNGPWNSGLKLHAAGYLRSSDGVLLLRGTFGRFWSGTNSNNTNGFVLGFDNVASEVWVDPKPYGFTIRCIKCVTPPAPTSGTHVPSPGQIIWNWNPVPGATGYKWHTSDDYGAATDMGNATTKTETGLTCNTAYTRFAWAYSACGNSTPLTMNQSTSLDPATPTTGTHVPMVTQITWNWNTVADATGYKWSTANNYAEATDMGNATTKTETGLTCNTAYTRFAWAYSACGNSTPLTMNQSTSLNPPATPTAGIHVPLLTQITWNWNTVADATGYKWSTANNYAEATDMGNATTKTETVLGCGTSYTRFVWAYNSCGNSIPVSLQATTTSAFAIGQSYGGGIIFWLDGTCEHGLIAATSDQSTGAEWGCDGYQISGTSTAIGTGQANTAAIVSGCSQAGTAARICYDLVLNGYNDWFLPSKDELNQMYLQKNEIGGFVSYHYYWSSSGPYAYFAWGQYFSNGYQDSYDKYQPAFVRAVRAF